MLFSCHNEGYHYFFGNRSIGVKCLVIFILFYYRFCYSTNFHVPGSFTQINPNYIIGLVSPERKLNLYEANGQERISNLNSDKYNFVPLLCDKEQIYYVFKHSNRLQNPKKSNFYINKRWHAALTSKCISIWKNAVLCKLSRDPAQFSIRHSFLWLVHSFGLPFIATSDRLANLYWKTLGDNPYDFGAQ